MTNSLVPSKSTVYISNLPFSLTNSDLHQIFEKCGNIVRITIMKHKITRRSRGVAFILFLKEESAKECIKLYDGSQLGDRTIKVGMAIDNGRSREFIKKRTYEDKSKCYECRAEGHLSYQCPLNTLGVRQPTAFKKKKAPKRRPDSGHNTVDISDRLARCYETDGEDDQQLENSCLETLSCAIKLERENEYRAGDRGQVVQSKRKRIRKSAYFSDEEELSE